LKASLKMAQELRGLAASETARLEAVSYSK